MAKMKPGDYQARIVNYGITNNKAGDPQLAILFEYNDEENQRHEVTWFGSFKEKALEWTLKTLIVCGFSGEDPAELATGVESGLLDTISPVTIVLDEQEYQGKRFIRVTWVNPSGGKSLGGRITKEEAKVKLGAMNLRGQMAMIRQKEGVPKPQSRPTAPRMREPGDDDLDFGDVGF